jgi:hypothetical protein
MKYEEWKVYQAEREQALQDGTLVLSEEEKAEAERYRKENRRMAAAAGADTAAARTDQQPGRADTG